MHTFLVMHGEFVAKSEKWRKKQMKNNEYSLTKSHYIKIIMPLCFLPLYIQQFLFTKIRRFEPKRRIYYFVLSVDKKVKTCFCLLTMTDLYATMYL
jgi:hypothetical protein